MTSYNENVSPADIQFALSDDGLDKVGPYRLIKKIGSGGMGVVYLAQRDDDLYHKQVAIKVLSTSLASNEGAKRFYRERQILANLSHVHIAQFLDGGVTQQGIPYIVMEYVDGVSILQYCQLHQCTLTERLRLFLQVCCAVSYAHHNLIIHRDIKPENILIDANGTAKLLDFGIAKALEEHPHHLHDNITEINGWPMTPQYASPEVLMGGNISTSSDLYSLGMVLYELLVGRPPYIISEFVLTNKLNVLRHQGITRPSYQPVVNEIPFPPKDLQGDLDWIVLKSLSFDIHERYTSVEQFQADIERYFDKRPIIARPPSRTYIFTKFVRRHTSWVVSGGMVLALCVSLAVLGINYIQDLKEERRLVKEQRDRANQATDFLIGLFQAASPYESQSHSLKAQDLLDKGFSQFNEAISLHPELKFSLQLLLGRIYLEIGEYDKSKELLSELKKSYISNGIENLTSKELGQMHFYLGRVLFYKSDYQDALKEFQEALVFQEKELSKDNLEAVLTYENIGKILSKLGEFEKASSFIHKALDIFESFSIKEHPYLGYTYSALGTNQQLQGKYSKAIQSFEKAIFMIQSIHGDYHPKLAVTFNNLANTYVLMGDYSKARQYFEKTLEIDKKVLGVKHPEYGISMMNLGIAWREQGEYQKAQKYFSGAMYLLESVLGKNHEEAILAKYNFAKNNQLLGRYEIALPLLEEVLVAYEKTNAPAYRRAAVMNALSMNYLVQNDVNKARLLNQRAIDMSVPVFGENHIDIAELKCTRADILVAQGLEDQAKKDYKQARAIYNEVFAQHQSLKKGCHSKLPGLKR